MNKNVRIALLFLGLLFVWFLSGFVFDTQKKEQSSKKRAVSQSVQVLNLKGQPSGSFPHDTDAKPLLNYIRKLLNGS